MGGLLAGYASVSREHHGGCDSWQSRLLSMLERFNVDSHLAEETVSVTRSKAQLSSECTPGIPQNPSSLSLLVSTLPTPQQKQAGLGESPSEIPLCSALFVSIGELMNGISCF